MATLKKYNLKGEEVGSVSVADAFVNSEAHGQLIKDYIVALRNNARQWSANTKGRSEVAHSTKKPHKQKGTGRARQGSLAAPQFKGGGRVHGPKPKFDQHVRINKKERRAAIRHLLAEKMRSGDLMVIEDPNFKAPKTKSVSSMLETAGCTRRVLFLIDEAQQTIGQGDEQQTITVCSNRYDAFSKSVRNLPRVECLRALGVDGHDVALANKIFVTETALEQIVGWLSTAKMHDVEVIEAKAAAKAAKAKAKTQTKTGTATKAKAAKAKVTKAKTTKTKVSAAKTPKAKAPKAKATEEGAPKAKTAKAKTTKAKGS